MVHVLCVRVMRRTEIATTCSKAYDRLHVDALRQLLMLDSSQESYAKCERFVQQV